MQLIQARADAKAQRRAMDMLAGRARLWKRAAMVSGITLVVLLGAAFAAVSVTDNSGIDALYAEVFGYDETKFTISAAAPAPSLGRSSAGTTFESPVEMTTGFPVANNGPSLLDWEYVVTVSELSDGSVPDPGASVYKATLYMNGASMGSLYFDQASLVAGVENVRLVWDLGTSLPGTTSFVVDIRTVSS